MPRDAMGSWAASRLTALGWITASNSRRSPSAMMWRLRTHAAFVPFAVAGVWASPLVWILWVTSRHLVSWAGCGSLLAAFGAFPRVVDSGDRIRVKVGVVLVGVEADLVAVGIVQVGQDPADAGPVHAGV